MAILGIDEVGRGPLAGPLVVGAVILPEEKPDWVKDLCDSKKLSAKKRELMSAVILSEAPAVGLGWVSPVEIDELGMGAALRLATRRAVEEVRSRGVAFSQIMIDGKVNFLSETSLGKFVSTVVRADDLIKEVSAASIVAKVARDSYMVGVAERFPEYGFEKHMGYGTALHREAISKLGICPEHRRSFEPVKSMVGFSRGIDVRKNTTSIGARGEEATCEYLVRCGHRIVARNFKTYFYEIDIVSVRDEKIYFTEVKTRRSDLCGGGLGAINAAKVRQMGYAAECFLRYQNKYDDLDPLLAVADVESLGGEGAVVKDWFAIS